MRVVPVTLPAEVGAAVDRDRIAFVESGSLHVLEVATGRRRSVHALTPGWNLELSPRGLRGDILVFGETRFEGQRVDGRVIRVDLRTGAATTLDEWSGPFLGGGDGWRAQAPVTNGSDLLWIRVTAEAPPFSVAVVVGPGVGTQRVLWTAASPVWADLHDSGRVAISTLVTPRDRAELVYSSSGVTPGSPRALSSVGDRPSPEGGPVLFVGRSGDVFWGEGPRIVRNITSGELISPTGARRRIDLGQDCVWVGGTAQLLHLDCGASASVVLLDPVSGTRDSIQALQPLQFTASHGAALWREGTQWWLGILAP